ncbi:hypothetical protein NVV93_16485 [Pseudomonas sp. LS44]|uniref:hypothetical protein n=1 Tax=Pseudomonas sp. LS44 TaxID=1357074 RepID=UPI00215B3D2D|nr:hypothetical protein [Pseudomonas sp. LS44]UVE17163.1 hypothetical protein NVV93_16485 [Pseudomonas sp. LS44]
MKSLVLATIFLLGALQEVSADSFDDYECTDDCSGHQAGYDWAEENDIDDESACDTPSNSFNEGCQSYVEGGDGAVTSEDDEDDYGYDDDDE